MLSTTESQTRHKFTNCKSKLISHKEKRSYIALYYSDFHIQNLSERYLKFVKVAYIILLHPVYYFMLLLYVYNQLDLTLNKGRPFLQTEVSIVK